MGRERRVGTENPRRSPLPFVLGQKLVLLNHVPDLLPHKIGIGVGGLKFEHGRGLFQPVKDVAAICRVEHELAIAGARGLLWDVCLVVGGLVKIVAGDLLAVGRKVGGQL